VDPITPEYVTPNYIFRTIKHEKRAMDCSGSFGNVYDNVTSSYEINMMGQAVYRVEGTGEAWEISLPKGQEFYLLDTEYKDTNDKNGQWKHAYYRICYITYEGFINKLVHNNGIKHDYYIIEKDLIQEIRKASYESTNDQS